MQGIPHGYRMRSSLRVVAAGSSPRSSRSVSKDEVARAGLMARHNCGATDCQRPRSPSFDPHNQLRQRRDDPEASEGPEFLELACRPSSVGNRAKLSWLRLLRLNIIYQIPLTPDFPCVCSRGRSPCSRRRLADITVVSSTNRHCCFILMNGSYSRCPPLFVRLFAS